MLFRTPLKQKVNTAKNIKFLNWLTWLEKLFTKKNILIDTDSCAYGKTHLVSKAQKIGGGWMFHSLGCSGCPLSKEELHRFKLYKKVSPMAPCCALLKSPLFSPTEVKNNEEVTLESYNILNILEQQMVNQEWIKNVMLPVPPVPTDGHELPTVPIQEEPEYFDDDDNGGDGEE